MATPASLPEGTMSPTSASLKVILSPVLSDAVDSPVAAARSLTTTGISSGAASKATVAVTILVMDAICACSSAERSK